MSAVVRTWCSCSFSGKYNIWLFRCGANLPPLTLQRGSGSRNNEATTSSIYVGLTLDSDAGAVKAFSCVCPVWPKAEKIYASDSLNTQMIRWMALHDHGNWRQLGRVKCIGVEKKNGYRYLRLNSNVDNPNSCLIRSQIEWEVPVLAVSFIQPFPLNVQAPFWSVEVVYIHVVFIFVHKCSLVLRPGHTKRVLLCGVFAPVHFNCCRTAVPRPVLWDAKIFFCRSRQRAALGVARPLQVKHQGSVFKNCWQRWRVNAQCVVK